ncbi:MAG: MFS transporter [Methanomassiliicoccales archaeon]
MPRIRIGFDRRIWVLFWSRLIDGAGFSIVYPFLALYMNQQLGASMTLVGVVLLVAGVAGAAGSLAGGVWADAYGRRKVMVVSMITRTLTFLLIALSVALFPDLMLVSVLLAFNFFLGGTFEPASNAMVADVVEPARQLEAYGLMRVAWNLGFAAGPAIGGLLTSLSYELAFLSSAFVSLLAALIVMLYLSESNMLVSKAERKRLSLDFSGISLSFLTFCALCVPLFVMAGQFGTTFPVFANDRLGIGQFAIGLVFALNGLMVALLQMPLARWLSRYNMFGSMFFGTLIYAVGFLSLAFIWEEWGLAASMIVITLGEMVVTPVSTSLTAAYSHAEDRGRHMGIFGLIASMGWFSSSLVGGVLYDNLESSIMLWGALASLGVVSAAGMALLRLRQPIPSGDNV